MESKDLENRIWFFTYCAFVIKILLFIYVKLNLSGVSIFGGGNDADYYHLYALGYYELIVNSWPVILRFLYQNGLYGREIYSLIFFALSVTLLPYLFYRLVKIRDQEIKPVKAVSFFLVIFYPSLFYFTLDVYREIVMFTFTIITLIIYKNILDSNKLTNILARNKLSQSFYFLIYLGLAYFLFTLREYLGFALFLSPFVYWMLLKTKKYIKTWIITYFVVLILIKISGGLDEILLYREEFNEGGSTLGIRLHDKNPIMFLIYYLYSIVAQLFGLFLVNMNSIIVFFLECIPFILAFIYIFKNKIYINNFVAFLLVFFVIYSTVWLLGNDNLGTATRLRIPSYLAVFACVFIVYQIKVLVSYEMIKEKMKKI